MSSTWYFGLVSWWRLLLLRLLARGTTEAWGSDPGDATPPKYVTPGRKHVSGWAHSILPRRPPSPTTAPPAPSAAPRPRPTFPRRPPSVSTSTPPLPITAGPTSPPAPSSSPSSSTPPFSKTSNRRSLSLPPPPLSAAPTFLFLSVAVFRWWTAPRRRRFWDWFGAGSPSTWTSLHRCGFELLVEVLTRFFFYVFVLRSVASNLSTVFKFCLTY